MLPIDNGRWHANGLHGCCRQINPDFLNLGAGSIGGKHLHQDFILGQVIFDSNGHNNFSRLMYGYFKLPKSWYCYSENYLSGGAQAKNIFWQTAGAVTLGTTSHFEGNILSQTGINLKTGASINGRMLANCSYVTNRTRFIRPQ
jgi:hypothetical protein